jgi:hypothetical protein
MIPIPRMINSSTRHAEAGIERTAFLSPTAEMNLFRLHMTRHFGSMKRPGTHFKLIEYRFSDRVAFGPQAQMVQKAGQSNLVATFGSPKEKAELDLVGGDMTTEAAAPAGAKPAFPSQDELQTVAVMAALASAQGHSTPTPSPKFSSKTKKSRPKSQPHSRRCSAPLRVG